MRRKRAGGRLSSAERFPFPYAIVEHGDASLYRTFRGGQAAPMEEFADHLAGDKGKIEVQCLGEAVEAQAFQFARAGERAGDRCGIDHEEPRIEPHRRAGGRDGTAEIVDTIEHRWRA